MTEAIIENGMEGLERAISIMKFTEKMLLYLFLSLGLPIFISYLIINESYYFALIFPLSVMLIPFILRKWEWVPVLLLPLIWYIPGQTAPGCALAGQLIFRWFGLIMLTAVFLVQAAKNIASAKPFTSAFIGKPIAVLIIVAIISNILNGKGILHLLGYLALYLQYPLFYIFLVNLGISGKVCRQFLIVFLILIFIQVPEVFFRFLFLGIKLDNVSLTLGPWGTYNIGVFSAYAIAFITAHAAAKDIRWYHLASVGILLAMGVMGEIKILIISTPIIILSIFAARHKPNQPGWSMRVIYVLFFIGLIIVISFNQWSQIYGAENELVKFINSIIEIFTQNSLDRDNLYRINRIGPVVMLVDLLKGSPLNLVFGLGPGSSLKGNFFGSPGQLFFLVPKSFMLTQITATLADVGLAGLSVYIWIFIIFLKRLLRIRRYEEIDPFTKVMIYGSFGVFIFYAFLGPIYNIVWRTDAPSFVFYFCMAYTHFIDQKHKGSVVRKSTHEYKKFSLPGLRLYKRA